MARRKNIDRPAEQPVQKPATRVPRRKRRKPSGARPHLAQPPRAIPRDDPQEGHPLHEPWATPIKTSRAPRAVEPPPSNPNVFSYTFTIWKSS
jgi:hypothetical protein